MTPEKKAFYEYGFEKGRLRNAIDTIRRRAWERHGAKYGEVVIYVRELVWNEFGIKGIIACVRQKRAACRAWVPLKERNCENCMHLHRGMKSDSPCFYCPGIDDEIPSNWVPRKEENE